MGKSFDISCLPPTRAQIDAQRRTERGLCARHALIKLLAAVALVTMVGESWTWFGTATVSHVLSRYAICTLAGFLAAVCTLEGLHDLYELCGWWIEDIRQSRYREI